VLPQVPNSRSRAVGSSVFAPNTLIIVPKERIYFPAISYICVVLTAASARAARYGITKQRQRISIESFREAEDHEKCRRPEPPFLKRWIRAVKVASLRELFLGNYAVQARDECARSLSPGSTHPCGLFDSLPS
jgi:hypothetical protein